MGGSWEVYGGFTGSSWGFHGEFMGSSLRLTVSNRLIDYVPGSRIRALTSPPGQSTPSMQYAIPVLT